MKYVGVIPSRWASTRFPGKPLALINGKSLLAWVIEGAKTSSLLNELLVATDDERIAKEASAQGLEVVMTDSALASGTDRVFAALKGRDCDVAVNIQGDEPLMTGELIDQLIAPFSEDPQLDMATLGREIKTLEDLKSPNTAKIVLNQKSEALYFSRHPIPFTRCDFDPEREYKAILKHLGIYAYRTSFLGDFCSSSPSELELMEGLEQLRALSLGARIKVVKVDQESWGVDTPEDVQKIERLMKEGRNGSKGE